MKSKLFTQNSVGNQHYTQFEHWQNLKINAAISKYSGRSIVFQQITVQYTNINNTGLDNMGFCFLEDQKSMCLRNPEHHQNLITCSLAISPEFY